MRSRVLNRLVKVIAVNWVLCFGVTWYLGGSALGTFPSKDGFVLDNNGKHAVVSESVWLFSLFYTGISILVVPVVFAIGILSERSKAWVRKKQQTRPMVIAAFLVFSGVAFVGIGDSLYQSVKDWRHYKPGPPLLERPAAGGTIERNP
jgi:hypothetical protein